MGALRRQFEHAVGDEQQAATGSQTCLAAAEGAASGQVQRTPCRLELERFGAVGQVWKWIGARVSVDELAGFQIDDGIEESNVLRNRERLEIGIQASEQLLRVKDGFVAARVQGLAVLTDQRGQDRSDESRGGAVPCDIRQVRAGKTIVQRKVIEEIPAEQLGRK